MKHNAWFTSEHGRYIGLLERDRSAPDVWTVQIWKAAFKPHMQVAIGGEYGDEFPAENLFDEPVEVLSGLLGYEYARDTMLEMLEECENDGGENDTGYTARNGRAQLVL